MRAPKIRRSMWTLGASIVLHGALVVVLTRLPNAPDTVRAPEVATAMDVEFRAWEGTQQSASVSASGAERARGTQGQVATASGPSTAVQHGPGRTRPTPAREAAREAAPRAPRPTPRPRRQKTSPTPPVTPETPPSPEESEADDTAPEEPRQAPPRPSPNSPVEAPDISPRAAAWTLIDLAPGCCDTAAEQADALDDEASASPGRPAQLNDVADASGYALEPTRDGGYRYQDTSMRAIIRPDGSVQFSSRVLGALSLTTPPPLLGDVSRGAENVGSGGTAMVDPVRLFSNSLPNGRKRSFLERTQALRERMRREDHARLLRRASAKLETKLNSAWNQAHLSAPEKRRALFTLWDGCADDPDGERGKQIVERFVREHLPEGSPLAYTASELVELNRSRVSTRAFAPYATG